MCASEKHSGIFLASKDVASKRLYILKVFNMQNCPAQTDTYDASLRWS